MAQKREKDKITFYVPLPPSLNIALRSHWSKRYKVQQEINDFVFLEIRRHFKSAIPDWGKIKVRYTIYSNRFIDKDGRVMVLKHINDSIVRAGLIVDDTDKYISYELPNMIVDPRAPSESRRVKVEIRREEDGKLSQS